MVFVTHKPLGVTVFQNSDFLRLLKKKSEFSSLRDLPQMSFSAKFMGGKSFQNFIDFGTVNKGSWICTSLPLSLSSPLPVYLNIFKFKNYLIKISILLLPPVI